MSAAAGLDLSYDDAQQAIADSVAQFCRDRCGDAVVRAAAVHFPMELWRALAELGVLALATPEGAGGALEVAAAMESLGRAAHPGPLAETFLATQLLPEAERRAVASGAALVAVGEPPLLSFAPLASVWIELAGGEAHLCEPGAAVEPFETLGGEPWGRVPLVRRLSLGDASRASALGDLALAAYLAAAGRRMVEDAAAHARARRQFGRPIAEFQAVSHPLADAAIGLDAAATLARVAAWSWDERTGDAHRLSGAARLSAARGAVRAAHAAHQAFGAQGVMRDGPAFARSRRIRQLAAATPGAGAAREALLGALAL
jgi:alkylation response protein AidB-like acyl-CoA dehydrogenase